jgi:serine/threonine protein kinase
MARLKSKLTFETTFDTYVADELIGEGGAGRVFAGTGADGIGFALKLLSIKLASTDKGRRFKNEIAFLSRNPHSNIVSVTDHGMSAIRDFSGPFYIMPRFDHSLREVISAGLVPERALQLFSQILDGVEAAHLLKVIHRDLKPENILYESRSESLAVADFGIARFNEDLAATLVQTKPSQKLANFQYAAPEQRAHGRPVEETADIYALGLILNEMVTGTVPHGTNYKLIGDVDVNFRFLDNIVSKMLAQFPTDRPKSIGEVKALIGSYRAEAITQQRISEINRSVIRSDEIDDPLALEAPQLISFDWDRGKLTLVLDRPVSRQWVDALMKMPRFGSIPNKPRHFFNFEGNKASIHAGEGEAQQVIDYFKSWLPLATQTLRQILESAARRDRDQLKEQLRLKREEEERRLRVLRSLKI